LLFCGWVGLGWVGLGWSGATQQPINSLGLSWVGGLVRVEGAFEQGGEVGTVLLFCGWAGLGWVGLDWAVGSGWSWASLGLVG